MLTNRVHCVDSYSSMPRMVTPGSPADDNDDYANQLRKVQKNLTSGGTLDPAGRVPNRRDAKVSLLQPLYTRYSEMVMSRGLPAKSVTTVHGQLSN